MKLFLQDHLSFIVLYIITIISLPIVFQQLDGLEKNYPYFLITAFYLLVNLLLFRYIRRRKMYASMEEKNIKADDFLFYNPVAQIEKAYASQLQSIQSLFLSKEDEHMQFSQEQQFIISHAVNQMKKPLSLIQLLIESNECKEPSLVEEWQKVKAQCNTLNFSLNQLLMYSRSTNLLGDLRIEPIFLKNVVQEVINELKDLFIEEEIYPKSTIGEDVLLFSDCKWLKVVINQLLSNAVKHGQKGTTISIDYDGQLLIKNRGESIPDNEINRVFDLYYTGSKGRLKGESTGIGLYLVKRILTTLDHPYSLHSENNETTFTIDFSKSMSTATP